jgi:DNA-binding transcriptional ArsR family regulator
MGYEEVLDALGDGTRRRILQRLGSGELSVGQIAQTLPVSRPAVSKHLRVLERSGLVTHVQVGTRNVYRIDTGGLEALREYVDEFWTGVLDAFANEAERERKAENDEHHA